MQPTEQPRADPDAVRCVDCGYEYTLARGAQAACERCGCVTWIAAWIRRPGARNRR